MSPTWADYENRLNSIDSRLDRVETKLDTFIVSVNARFTLLTWAVGINAAATIAIFGLLWQLASALAALNSAIGGLHR